jgi:septal ring factor EnvC (AmiA/AmiB activator)
MVALAALPAQGASQEENLKALRSRIEALTVDLDKKEGSQREARDALRDSERAISNANRALARLAASALELRAEAGRVAERRRVLAVEVSKRESSIERMLVAWAAGGAPDALRVALSGDDPADIGRRLHYFAHISRAAASLLAEQRAAVAEL